MSQLEPALAPPSRFASAVSARLPGGKTEDLVSLLREMESIREVLSRTQGALQEMSDKSNLLGLTPALPSSASSGKRPSKSTAPSSRKPSAAAASPTGASPKCTRSGRASVSVAGSEQPPSLPPPSYDELFPAPNLSLPKSTTSQSVVDYPPPAWDSIFRAPSNDDGSPQTPWKRQKVISDASSSPQEESQTNSVPPATVRRRSSKTSVASFSAAQTAADPSEEPDTRRIAAMAMDFVARYRREVPPSERRTAVVYEALAAYFVLLNEERAARLRLVLRDIDWREGLGRAAVLRSYNKFVVFCMEREPQWRKAARELQNRNAEALNDPQAKLARFQFEETVVCDKEHMLQEALDYLVSLKFAEQDEQRLARQRAIARRRSETLAASRPSPPPPAAAAPAQASASPPAAPSPAAAQYFHRPQPQQQQQQQHHTNAVPFLPVPPNRAQPTRPPSAQRPLSSVEHHTTQPAQAANKHNAKYGRRPVFMAPPASGPHGDAASIPVVGPGRR